jgi:putative transcriptional regulator
LGESKRAADPIYLGGPVELQDVMALVKSPKKPDDSSSVLSEVYLLSSKTALEKGLAASAGAGDLRVYLGYCGWEAGQLENEVRQGGWWIFAADRGFPNSGVVFDPNPETLWARLIVRTEQQIAQNTPPNAIPPTSTDEGEGR